MIIVKNLSVKIANEYILEDVSMQIENGHITAILGPNGSGKTTLLQCLSRPQNTSTGSVELDRKHLSDYSLNGLATKRAVLSQSNPMSFPFTALEIVMMGRSPHTSTNNKNHEIALEALESMDAINLKERIFPTLSGGEQQRIQLARVLAQLWEQENAYLFLDEPTSALDLKHQHQLLNLTATLAKKKCFAVCIIMHDLNLAMRYADHVIFLKDGRLFASGSTATTLNKAVIEEVFEVSGDYVIPLN